MIRAMPPTHESQRLRDTILEVTESLLESQLAAIRALRQPLAAGQKPTADLLPKGRSSQVGIAFDILSSAASPLHVMDIIEKAKARGVVLDRESLVSALTKRVLRADRFVRTAPNTFALLDPKGRPEAPLP
jgi:hypothetical protein